MELSRQQVKQVIDYLLKWQTAKCGICGHDDWTVSSAVFMLPEYRSPKAPVYSSAQDVFPVIPLTCKTCGNVLFVSAIAAGVVPGRIEVHQNG
jgi:hypothetical protein